MGIVENRACGSSNKTQHKNENLNGCSKSEFEKQKSKWGKNSISKRADKEAELERILTDVFIVIAGKTRA